VSISNTTETAILALIFNATTWANYAINATSSPQTDIAVALHTADPTDAGTQASSEIAYTGYARVEVDRNSGGWTVSGGSVSPVADIEFPEGAGGSGTATHFSTGKVASSAAILFSGSVTPNIICGSGIQPILDAATAITLD
jgi:hypothetical protein